MPDRTPLSETIQAFSLILAMMAENLEKAAAFSRPAFATRLRQMADDAERMAPEHLRGTARLDLQIARLVADLIGKGQIPPVTAHSWTPVVIEGGASDQSPDQD